MAWRIVTVVFMFTGLLSIVIGIPGTFIILGVALIYGIFTNFQIITAKLLFVLLGFAIVGELIEAFLGLLSASKFGASRLSLFFGLVGGFAGALIGSLFLPVVGTLIGAIAGVFLGTFLPELALKKEFRVSVRAGLGAFLGRTAGTFTKLVLGAIMVGLVAARLF